MFHILEAFTRWVAPVLSFTAEEIWAEIPNRADQKREDSVLMATWYEGLFELHEHAERERWDQVMVLREAVARAIEALRKDGTVGSSLGSEVGVYADGAAGETLAWLGDELRFILITSDAISGPLADAPQDATLLETELGSIALLVKPSEHAKCVRCWHRREDVGASDEHPELCGRCISNVEGPGERRRIG